MSQITYQINDLIYSLDVDDRTEWVAGDEKTLSNEESDPTFNSHWYTKGVECIDLFSEQEFVSIQEGIKKCIEFKINRKIKNLEKYHEFVDEQLHQEVVKYTRNLHPKEFNFQNDYIYKKLSQIMGFKLSDLCKPLNINHSIIIRINRPLSLDYNPPHKDGHEVIDYHNLDPNFINVWIPICGVSDKSSLPFAIGSHLIPENKIIRSKQGAVISDRKYHVRCIKEWNGSNVLERIPIVNKQAFLFSPFLVHGLALNQQEDTTRIALEFRLFRQKS